MFSFEFVDFWFSVSTCRILCYDLDICCNVQVQWNSSEANSIEGVLLDFKRLGLLDQNFQHLLLLNIIRLSLLRIETDDVCRERGKYLFWLGSLLCSHCMLLVFTGGIITMIFYIHCSCCLQNLFHLSGMLFSSSWSMVCSCTLLICFCHFIWLTCRVVGKSTVVNLN